MGQRSKYKNEIPSIPGEDESPNLLQKFFILVQTKQQQNERCTKEGLHLVKRGGRTCPKLSKSSSHKNWVTENVAGYLQHRDQASAKEKKPKRKKRQGQESEQEGKQSRKSTQQRRKKEGED